MLRLWAFASLFFPLMALAQPACYPAPADSASRWGGVVRHADGAGWYWYCWDGEQWLGNYRVLHRADILRTPIDVAAAPAAPGRGLEGCGQRQLSHAADLRLVQRRAQHDRRAGARGRRQRVQPGDRRRRLPRRTRPHRSGGPVPQAVKSPRTAMNPAELRGLLAKAQVRLLELEQAVERSDSLIAELLCERVVLRRDLAEWERIAADRAKELVDLQHRLLRA